MKWKQFRLKTTTQAEDIVSSMLADLGIEGVQIEDKIPLTEQDKEQMFVDILPDIPDDDGTAYLTFYLDEEDRRCRLGQQLEAVLPSILYRRHSCNPILGKSKAGGQRQDGHSH